MTALVHGSLGHLRAQGYTIRAYCEGPGSDACRHNGPVDMARAIEVFGPGFIVPSDHARFVQHCRCAECGRRRPTLIVQIPPGAEAGQWSPAGTPGSPHQPLLLAQKGR